MTAQPFEIKGAHKRRVLVAAETLRMVDLAADEAQDAEDAARDEALAAGGRHREAQDRTREARTLAATAANELFLEVTRR